MTQPNDIEGLRKVAEEAISAYPYVRYQFAAQNADVERTRATRYAKAIAAALDAGLNGDQRPKRVGFTVLLFNFGDEGQVNYVSNADRADMIASMKSLLARWEGQPVQSGHA